MTDGKHSSITEELNSGKSVTYFTVGISMRPLLTERKTHVMIAPITEVKTNDILLYIRKNGNLVLHRCMKQDGDCYYMRGDNTYGLEPIKKEQAIGIATHVYRKGKQIVLHKSIPYRLYVVLWRWLYPFRWLFFKVKSAARRLLCTSRG